MIKKIAILIVFMLCIAGCGESDGKKEVQALNDKYLNAIYKTLYDMNVEMRKQKDWSKEILEISKKYGPKLQDIGKNIEAEKVPKKAEPYKNALKAYLNHWQQMFELGQKEMSYTLDNKPENEIKKIRDQADKVRDNSSQIFYELENERSKVIDGKPATVMGVNGVNYLAFTASNVDMAIIEAKNHTKAIGDNPYFQKKPIGKFVIVKIFVKNNQKDAITVDSNNFKIVDNQKREYSVSTEGQTAYTMGKEDSTKGFLSQLNPNMGTDFTFVFDVPHELNSLNTKLQAKGGFSGKSVLMPLVPVEIKTVKQ